MNVVERALNSLIHRSLRPRFEEIRSSVRVTNEWLDLPCQKPERPRGCSQWISLSIPGYDFDIRREDFEIRLPNGKVVVPMIEVADARGSIFGTTSGQRGGSIVAFRVTQSDQDIKALGDHSQKITLRIRSDEPFESGPIGWVTQRMK